jgi:hypothetical protein
MGENASARNKNKKKTASLTTIEAAFRAHKEPMHLQLPGRRCAISKLNKAILM